jgi:hypothetical protein
VIRLIAIAVWICIVTAASAYVSGTWRLGPDRHSGVHDGAAGTGRKTTPAINVPIIVNGAVEGYVTAQFIYLVDMKALKQISIEPDAFVTDEAFRTLYSEPFDFSHIEKYDMVALTRKLAINVNRRLGEDIIKDVLVGEFNYVAKGDISK